MAKYGKNLKSVADAFDRDALAKVCVMPEAEFAEHYDMRMTRVDQPAPDHFFCYQDNGSDILAVAHLDTVGKPWQREAHFIDTEAGPVVYSRALDDRLGAYIIMELLPKLGLKFDVLLTVGEETGRSTAAFFDAPLDKEYKWGIEFDRGGTDVVSYQYDNEMLRERVRATGTHMGDGILSDICYLEHLGVQMLNWGVGYRDYHGPRAHAYLDDTMGMVARFLKFHQQNADIDMPHVESKPDPFYSRDRGTLECIWDGDELVPLDSYGDSDPWYFGNDEPDRGDDPAYRDDPDWIEYPTLEDIQRHEEQMDRESGRFDRLDQDWMDSVRAQHAS